MGAKARTRRDDQSGDVPRWASSTSTITSVRRAGADSEEDAARASCRSWTVGYGASSGRRALVSSKESVLRGRLRARSDASDLKCVARVGRDMVVLSSRRVRLAPSMNQKVAQPRGRVVDGTLTLKRGTNQEAVSRGCE